MCSPYIHSLTRPSPGELATDGVVWERAEAARSRLANMQNKEEERTMKPPDRVKSYEGYHALKEQKPVQWGSIQVDTPTRPEGSGQA
jgi:hypothetical protein